MKILPLFVLLACVAWQACAQDDEPAAPPRPVARGLPKRGPNPRAKATTTTTPAPQEDFQYDDDSAYPADEVEASSEAPVSSTEGKRLVGSGVRPFRSNADLLDTLKRRRQQAEEEKLRGHSNSEPSSAEPVEPARAKSSYNKKRTNAAPKESPAEELAPSKPTRGRFGRPATRSIQPEETPVAPAPAPAPAQSAEGRTSRFGRRPSH